MVVADRSGGNGGTSDSGVATGGGVRERIERIVTSTPRGGPAVVGAIGIGLFVITLLNFFRELREFGFGWPQIAAVLLGAWLSAVVVYGAIYLSGTAYTSRQRWLVAAASLLGVGFVYVVMYVTVFVRPSVGLRVGGPTLQLLASAHAGAVAGYLIGLLYVKARRDAQQARQVGRQLEFMHSILRHDVLNSMTVVRARAEHLDQQLDGSYQPSLDAILNQTESVIDLSQRARATVDALATDDDATPEPVDLPAVLREEIATVRSTYDALTVTADVPDDVVVRADDMLPAVFGNLLSNAVQHNDADDRRIHVTVRAGAESVEVRIGDNGPGIPDDEKEAVFEQGHSSSGGGFGLFFVRTMVDHYGGSVHVEDNQPRGSVFVVSLPRADRERTATVA
ncbi:MAG: ATP-binding protein [Halorientalis sp.]